MLLIIIGASARAAAQSMRAAGHEVFTIDLFADRDLRAIAPCLRLPFTEYPRGFLELLKRAPPGPVMYTGGLENYPDLIDEIAATQELIGNPGSVLRRVRDPFFIHRILKERGLPSLAVADRPTGNERWLWKPLRGSSGSGIRHWSQGEAIPVGGYFQEFALGEPYSANFVCDPSGIRFLGICRQLIATAWLNAPPFRYAGNIGPVALPRDTEEIVRAMGESIALAGGLRGPFGIDFLWDGGPPMLCEVNPRYTAAVEVLERARAAEVVGKGVVYAVRRTVFPEFNIDSSWADVPGAGEVIDEGMPICTRFAMGRNAEEVWRRLEGAARESYGLIE